MTAEIGEPWSKDKMERKGVAKFLTHYLDNNIDINVLNVNAPWGAGKTFFLENWCAGLQSERAVIYFNAWKHDYAGDAFIALTASINDALVKYIPLAKAEEELKEFRGKAVGVIKAATPALAKGVIKKFTGVDVSVLSEILESDALGDATEKALEELLKSNRKTMQVVDDFKEKFSSLASQASEFQAKKANVDVRPLYIFIDELDRCRPTFSIELLERVKHFFDVKGCKFIIACDLEQLQHSIGAVYGSGFEGGKYLKRFFDAEYSLSYSNLDALIKSLEIDESSLADIPVLVSQEDQNGFYRPRDRSSIAPSAKSVLAGALDLNKYQVVLLAVAKTFNIKPREFEKCFKQLTAIRTVAELDFDLFFAFYLIVFRDEAPTQYRQILEHNATEDWNIIESKYPSRELYSGGANDPIHSLAKRYFHLMHKSTSEIQKLIQQDESHGTMKSFVLWRFNGKGYGTMKKYPNYVDLAHSIA
ncbi:KAP family P-loop NTPase fold protein [Pseudomonas sp. RL_15y_Pfl2_60]|uniref:KAP family P-loop NTPase fold protein n=1 Tax=Pseudomonas sp. RL_15y_Pfl2_60 TaxID=3088709 RepID=UPI0030D7A4FC